MKQESPPPTLLYLENVFLAWVIIGLGLVAGTMAFLMELTTNILEGKMFAGDITTGEGLMEKKPPKINWQ